MSPFVFGYTVTRFKQIRLRLASFRLTHLNLVFALNKASSNTG